LFKIFVPDSIFKSGKHGFMVIGADADSPWRVLSFSTGMELENKLHLLEHAEETTVSVP
jgi:hypothetical protein